MVPTFTAVRLTGEAPGYTPAVSPRLRRRPSPWPPGSRQVRPDREFPARQGRVRTAIQPTSTGLELATTQEA